MTSEHSAQVHPTLPHPCSRDGGTSQCLVGGSPPWQEGVTGHRHAVRLWADLEAPWALWMMAGHFSRRSSLLFSKKPSLRGTPWEPSGKVRRPGQGREGLGPKGQGAAPTGARAGTGEAEQEMLDGAMLSWGRMDLRLPTPCCQALTKAVHAPAFELALKGHIVEAGKNADAVELPLHKLPLVPEGEEFLRQKLPAERGDVCGVHTGVPHSPGAIREGEHTTAMEESILEVPHVSGAISKRQLPHTMPAT